MNRVSELPPRLQTVLDLLSPCRLLADVGTDHAKLPVRAIECGIAQRALAIDVLSKPLRGARRTVEASGLSSRIDLVQADGFSDLERGMVDAVTIAGMSGRSMVRICRQAAAELAQVQQLVIQPNLFVEEMREFAFDAGFHLSEERMIRVGRRFFVTCRFTPGSGPDPAYELDGLSRTDAFRLGPLLAHRKDPLTLEYFLMQRARLAVVANDRRKAGTVDLDRGFAELAFTERACAWLI